MGRHGTPGSSDELFRGSRDDAREARRLIKAYPAEAARINAGGLAAVATAAAAGGTRVTPHAHGPRPSTGALTRTHTCRHNANYVRAGTPGGLTPKQARLMAQFLSDEGRIRETLLAAANATLKHLYRSVAADAGEPVTDESTELQAVVMVLDQCLRHAFKGRFAHPTPQPARTSSRHRPARGLGPPSLGLSRP